jgi:hypothetical protein
MEAHLVLSFFIKVYSYRIKRLQCNDNPGPAFNDPVSLRLINRLTGLIRPPFQTSQNIWSYTFSGVPLLPKLSFNLYGKIRIAFKIIAL